jgi:hypothetical protein
MALAVSTAWAAGPGSGLAGSAHDFTANATTVYQWMDLSKPATPVATTYNTGTALCKDGTYTAGVSSCAAANPQQTSSIGKIGLCTKCHTPHKAKSTNLLWNHTLLATQYSWDDTKTTAGTVYPTFVGDTYKGPTTKCLSCHDGTMASTDGMWFNRQSVTGSKYAGGGLDSGHDIADGATPANMSGNHPVAFPYPLNGVTNTYNGTSSGPAIASADWVADPSPNGIMLYNQAGGAISRGVLAGNTGMECGSCHDVHNGPRTLDVHLLTGKVIGAAQSDGYICMQCHKK